MKHWWNEVPWRMIQTNMRQIDMEDIKAESFVEELRKFHASVVLINTGGILASYDSQVEDHPRSENLHGDSLFEIMTACRKAGIRVIARMDFSKIRRAVYEKHPDWAYRDPNGEIVDYNGDVHACICGGFQQEKAFEITREVCERLPVDGLFINMGGFRTRDYSYRYHGLCHCQNCRRRFMERFGENLPEREELADPVYRKYLVFQEEVLADHKRRLTELVRGINPEIALDGIDFARMESNTEYGRPLPFWQYSASSNTRGLLGITGDRVSSNTSVDFIGFYYRHVAVNPEEQELRLWQDVANFGGVDYYIIGRLDNHEDRSAFRAVQRVFRYAEEHEEEYRGIQSLARVLVLRTDLWNCLPEERGWVRALTESHVLFDEVVTSALGHDASLERYQTIIVPGIKRLPHWLTEKLDAFALSGGCIIVSGEACLYDENYDLYPNQPLHCLGIQEQEFVRRDMLSAMLRVDDSDLVVFDSFADNRLIYFGETFCFERGREEGKGYLRLIPPHPYGPPERCYYTQITDLPGIWVNSWGRGRGIRIPWCCGERYYRDGYANTLHFMRDLLLNIASVESVEAAPFTPMVGVTAGISGTGSYALIQLVNHTGHFGTSYFPPVPVRDIPLRISLPAKPADVVTQTEGKAVPYIWREGKMEVFIPELKSFEGLLVKLEPEQGGKAG